MAQTWSYTTIGSYFANAINRDDLGSRYPEFLDLAEQRIAKEIFPRGFETRGTGTFVAGTPTVVNPSSYREIKSFDFVANGTRINLEERTYEYCIDYAPATAATGTPKYYAPYGSGQFYVAPTPGTNWTYQIVYNQRLTPLEGTGTAGTNWLTQNHPDLLIAALMLEAEMYLKNDQRIGVWQQKYAGAAQALMEQWRRENADRYQDKIPPKSTT